MKIVVCIKQVPNTSEVKLDPVTNTLIRDGVPSIINPDDRAALEAALRIKDSAGAGVTALCMGPPQAETALREALAMGADEAVLITDRAFGGSDTWATSCVLAAAARKIGFDLILTGRQAIDGDTAQVGPQIAEHLKLPSISYAEELSVSGGSVTVRRQYEDRCHILRAKLPCLVTALSELCEPRYMTVGGIFDAWREREVRVLSRADIEVGDADIGLKGSPTRVAKSFTKEPKGQGTVVSLEAGQAAAWLAEKLREKFIL